MQIPLVYLEVHGFVSPTTATVHNRGTPKIFLYVYNEYFAIPCDCFKTSSSSSYINAVKSGYLHICSVTFTPSIGEQNVHNKQ